MKNHKKELIDLFIEVFNKIDELISKVNTLTKQVSSLQRENKNLMNQKKEIEKENNKSIKLYHIKENNNNELKEKNQELKKKNIQLEMKMNLIARRGYIKILLELCWKMIEISVENFPYLKLSNEQSRNLFLNIKKIFNSIAHKKHNQNDTIDSLFDELIDYFKTDLSKIEQLKKIQKEIQLP